MSLRNKCVALTLLLTFLLTPLRAAQGAGGEIAGAVTDPKGAVVVGASVTVYPEAGGQPVAAVKTDAQGQYRVPNVPPGNYTVGVAAEGFGPVTSATQAVAGGKTTKLDFKLEVAAVETSVTVTASGPKPNSDPVYRALRTQGDAQDFTGEYARVAGLVLKRDAATFRLNSGEVYFLPAVEGRVTGAVFIGEGELELVPPVEHERRSLALFTGEPALKEQFTRLTLRFTDQTYEEIRKSPQAVMAAGGPQAQRARDLFRDNQELLRTRLRTNMELRTLVDLYTPERPGFLVAFVGGRRFEKLVFEIDPLGIPEVSPEEVRLSSYGETDWGSWTAFHLSDEYRSGGASADEDHRIFDITRHEIDGAIKGTQIAAADTITFRALAKGSRVLPFQLFPSLRVGRVRDEQGRDLQFVQEGKNRDSDFALIWPEPLEAGKTYKVTVEYQGGDALQDFGGGNFYLGPRLTWHPNNYGSQAGDRAVFDMTFRYPKGKMFIGTGAPSGAAAEDGQLAVARWSSGQTELAVAGFNYGVFKKKEVADKEAGYQIEFYANESLTSELSLASNGEGPRPRTAPGTMVEGRGLSAADGLISTTGMADSAIADAQNSTRIYNAYFGKLPYSRVALTQQPAGNFGQAWPTLVYMPYTAFLDSTQRLMLSDSVRAATNDFYDYVGPHEVAHQWWGHIVGWKSYRDQWMSEGFAEFSTSLWVQAVKGEEKFVKFWESQRRRIVESRPQTRDLKPYTVGPVTQGFRLSSGKTGAAYQFMVYPKGAYILHMLRMMMFDRKTGDKRFMEMMQDFTRTHYNRDVSTEDFKRAVEKHMTPEMDIDENGRMDWFFNQWVYGTEVPSYRFEYTVSGDLLTGRVTQSGVSDNFRMLVPVYVDLGKGWVRLGAATIRGNSTTDLGQIRLPQAPRKVAVAPFKDVLALSVENKKQ